MATAYDLTNTAAKLAVIGDGSDVPWGTSGDGFGRASIIKIHCSMPDIVVALGAEPDGTASDTLKIMDIPTGTRIDGVLLDVTTAEGAAATCSIGDASNAAGWIAASTSLNSVAKTGTVVGDTYGAANIVYAAADHLIITFAGVANIDTCVFDVYVFARFIDF